MFNLDTKHKRKSAALTTVIMSLLLVLMFYVGLTYLDPPEEYGIAVNFGTTDFGKGTTQPTKELAPAPVQDEQVEEEIEEVQEQVEEPEVQEQENSTVEEVTEDVVTQNNEEAIAIKKKEEAKRKAEEEAARIRKENERKERLEKERLEKIERERQAKIAQQKAEEDAKRKRLDALIGGVGNANGTETGGEGNDNKAGDKGQLNGNPYAPSYFGGIGSGSGGIGYGLNGRGRPTSKTYKQNCNEEGLVVVRIEVNRQGNVIKATPGAKGTTNSDPCLFEPAKRIALSFKWPSDANAPIKQVGYVSINFKLGQ